MARMPCLWFLLAVLCVLVPAGESACCAEAAPSDVDGGLLKPLVAKYCLDCHGEGAEAGRLRLDRLPDLLTPADPADTNRFADYVQVFDKLSAGEMPPKDAPQPPAAEARSLLERLRTRLHEADRARQLAEGRVVFRRLNRVEFEQTVHDLLAVDRPLAHLLPEDGSAFGFDNVGAALNTSSQLMERYLEAADAALEAAIVDGPRPETVRRRYKYVEEPTVIMLLNKASTSRMFAVQGDAYIMFSDYIPYGGGKLAQFRAPAAGRYRMRVSAYGHRGPVTLRAYGGATHQTPNQLIGHYDLPADKPTIVEFEADLPLHSTITLLPYRLKRIGFVGIGDKLLEQTGMALEWVEIEGPIVPEWPPESYRRLFGDLDLGDGTLADAEAVLRRFVPRAWRRPVTDDEIRPYVDLVRSRLDEQQNFRTAIKVGLQAVLCSPRFLFLDEKPGRLTDPALASRLSYFLWSSAPDDELRALARDGKLARPEVLRGQVERMLADPKSERFIRNFVGQWLDLRKIDDTTPDKQLYPEHDELLQVSMVAETERFFREILERDLSVTNFVDSDFSILNERLARHYGIEGVTGQAFRRVELPPDSHRGGVLTQAAVLKVTANGTNTSPVVRGVWVMDNILGQPVPPPPPDVPAVEPDIRGAVTIRQQLAKHRQSAACASCHRKIDPVGFALENFDVIGGRRERYRSLTAGEPAKAKVDGLMVKYLVGLPIESADELPDGRKFAHIDELKQLLGADPERIARSVAGKLLTYATGGGLQFADRQALDEIVADAREHGFGLRTIVHGVVRSEAFLSK
jgi:hypothetical protein